MAKSKAPTAEKKITISLRLSASQLRRANKVAHEKGTTRSAILQMALSEYLKKEGV